MTRQALAVTATATAAPSSFSGVINSRHDAKGAFSIKKEKTRKKVEREKINQNESG